jgi:GrpB-like predicted nucleotidyltransferase (UPF0157 family)
MDLTSDVNRWEAQFDWERERVFAALGELSDGGIVEQLEHVGATSVPGLLGRPCVDIALAVWPFPLEEPALQALASLDYELDPHYSGAPEQRFRHASTTFQLYVLEAGSPLWTDFVLVRDYLCGDGAARQAFSALKQGWSGSTEAGGYYEAKSAWLDQCLGNARRSWIEREGFAPLRRVTEELRDLSVPWHICGGWALDVFLGQVTRVHQDVDVVLSRADQFALQQHMTTHGWKLLTPSDRQMQPWPEHMRLELPRHQVHAHRGGRFIDFLLADLGGGVWRYRRDPSIIRDLDRIGLCSDEGVPFLAPELVLLFKSKNTSGRERRNDQADFDKVYTKLEPERRVWLRWALTATDASHPWINQL